MCNFHAIMCRHQMRKARREKAVLFSFSGLFVVYTLLNRLFLAMPNTLALAFKKQVPFLQKSSPRKEMDKVLFMCFPKTLNPWCTTYGPNRPRTTMTCKLAIGHMYRLPSEGMYSSADGARELLVKEKLPIQGR